jgi:cob(I)alamin adenosyltransferase
MVPKTDPRIEAYGTVDELSATLGIARCALDREAARFTDAGDAALLAAHLVHLQNQLFTLGGDLATRVADRHPLMPVVTANDVARLEALCDAFNATLAPLQDFVLPGGSEIAAALHVARTVCRRAERRVCALAAVEDAGPHVAIYLNRLADALFVLSRWANARMGVAEPTWRRDLPAPPLPGA